MGQASSRWLKGFLTAWLCLSAKVALPGSIFKDLGHGSTGLMRVLRRCRAVNPTRVIGVPIRLAFVMMGGVIYIRLP